MEEDTGNKSKFRKPTMLSKSITLSKGAVKTKILAKKKKWKKPKGKPKRPLSAYNLFFKRERQTLLHQGYLTILPLAVDGNFGSFGTARSNFAGLARIIATKWKKLTEEDKEEFKILSEAEQQRYRKELRDWELLRGQTCESKCVHEKHTISQHAEERAKRKPRKTSKCLNNAMQKSISDKNISEGTAPTPINATMDVANNPSNPSFCNLTSQLDNEDVDFLLLLRDL